MKNKIVLIHKKNFNSFWAHYDVFSDKNFIEELNKLNVKLFRSIDRPKIIPDKIIYIESDSLIVEVKYVLIRILKFDIKALLTLIYMSNFKNSYWYEKKQLIAFEGVIHQPKNHSPRLLKKVNTVLTWNIDLTLRYPDKFIKYNWPQPLYINSSAKKFSEKKLFINVSANKNSNHPNELYSERLRIIKFLSEQYPENFDLYGFGWENYNSLGVNKSVYRGILKLDKTRIMGNYKFAIVYENATFNGWVTEKIFDCLRSMCIPIYLGARDISNYLPEYLYVDPRKYNSYKEMFKELANISEQDHVNRLKKIKHYLNSLEFLDSHSCKAFARTIAENID